MQTERSSRRVSATFARRAGATPSSAATASGSPVDGVELDPVDDQARRTAGPASRSLPRKKIASSTGSRSGLVTIRNVVAGSASSA
jgi:hypothetical protein